MLILIISVVFLVLGLILHYGLCTVVCGRMIMLLSLTVLCVTCVLWGYCGLTKNVEYDKKLHEKELLEYRLKNEQLPGNELLFKDITKFNNEIREIKYYSNSFVVGIFYNEKIATIDYINFEYR